MSHKIADASSFLTFIKNWAATARHIETNVICPEFVAAKVFPPKDVVNLRKRMNQPLPDDSFGNFFQDAVTISLQDTTEECYSLVNQLRESALQSQSIMKAQQIHNCKTIQHSIHYYLLWSLPHRCEEFVAAKLFPPIDVVGGFDRNINPTEMNVVMKRFVFSDSAITALRAKYACKTSTENQIYPTRVEALSSFIWSRFQASTQPKIGLEKPLLLVHAVNYGSTAS
ncbi:hypothetical protein Q3G72_013849 [Acer saccharum]|nr:hypothetical protein Q3G72_013849 [Acer saccharum]